MGKKKRRPSGSGSIERSVTPPATPAAPATPSLNISSTGVEPAEPGEIVLADERMNPRILTWSPDGKYLVTLGRWCEMFWNTSTWTLEFILHEDPAWFVTPGSGGHLRFSPDSTRLYVLSSTGVVAWDVPDRRLAWKTAREDRAHAISIDAACTVILCHGGRLIDARTGAWRRAEYPPIPDKHPGGETFVTISPDGRLVATLASDQMSRFTHGMPTRRWVRARDVDTLELVQELAIDPVPTDPARAQAYMDDFPFPPETKEYDAMDTKVSAPGFFFGIELISYACNGRFLVCYSFDETAYVIDMGGRPWRVQRTIPIRPYKAHHTMSYTPWLVDDPFSHDRRWIVEPANDQDDTLVVRAVDPGRDKHPCDIIKG